MKKEIYTYELNRGYELPPVKTNPRNYEMVKATLRSPTATTGSSFVVPKEEHARCASDYAKTIGKRVAFRKLAGSLGFRVFVTAVGNRCVKKNKKLKKLQS